MKALYKIVVLLCLLVVPSFASADSNSSAGSQIATAPATLTPVGTVFTPPCPQIPSISGVYNIVVTATGQSVALPTCPSSSVGLFATFNICNGLGGTAPCNGTASGPFSPGLKFGSGFEFTSSAAYVETQSSGAKDIVTCVVLGTTGPWSCGSPQLAVGAPVTVPGTFDTNRVLSGMTLSNSNQTFTITGSSSVNYSGFGTVFHSSGFPVFEFTYTSCSTVPGPGACEIGAADSSELDSNYLGQTTHSFGWRNDGLVLLNGNTISSGFPTWVSGNVLDLAVDLTNHLICGRVNGGAWSPATPGGACLSIPGMSSYNLSWAAKGFTNGDAGTIDASPTVAGTTPW